VKRHLLVERVGVPLAVTSSGANRHDMRQTAETLDALVITRPDPQLLPQHLCLDLGYDYDDSRQAAEERGYRLHIPARGLDTSCPVQGDPARHPARRWVVERTQAWLHKFRKLLVRYERKTANYLGLVHLACALIVARKLLG
jgi:putative transposase